MKVELTSINGVFTFCTDGGSVLSSISYPGRGYTNKWWRAMISSEALQRGKDIQLSAPMMRVNSWLG